MLSVIIPACNEAAHVGPCLEAILAGHPVPEGLQVIVVANGCHDDTAARARGFAARCAAAGIGLHVAETGPAGKPAALNIGDAAAEGTCRLYLDADVIVSPPLLAQLAATLAAAAAPLYASGTLRLARSPSRVTRLFARAWATLPYVADGVPGAGLYAVNAAGRARWGAFPDIICDDGYVRQLFTAAERVAVPAEYVWPLADGAAALVRVRRRQEVGNRQLERLYPQLTRNQGRTLPKRAELLRAARTSPAGFVVYAGLTALAKLTTDPEDVTWRRSR